MGFWKVRWGPVVLQKDSEYVMMSVCMGVLTFPVFLAALTSCDKTI